MTPEGSGDSTPVKERLSDPVEEMRAEGDKAATLFSSQRVQREKRLVLIERFQNRNMPTGQASGTSLFVERIK